MSLIPSEYLSHLASLQQGLKEAFCADHVEVRDDSSLHQGHRGVQNMQGVTHLSIVIVAQVFDQYTRLQRHRLVYQTVENLWGRPIHALEINVYSPLEWVAQQ